MANNVASSDRKSVFETPTISRLSLGRTLFSDRKLSIPSVLNSNLLGIPVSSNNENVKDGTNSKRRFSNVGDTVSRKLSSTIGWRNNAVPIQEVVSQGRFLCGQYIKHRLKRSGIFSKKTYLSQLRNAVGSPEGETVADVAPFLIAAGVELERMFPKIFTGISRQATTTPGGVFSSEKTAHRLLITISHEVLKSDITWGKVVSVFAVAGGLAVDCVCQGHPEYIHGLMEGMLDVLEDDLAEWIAVNGGWTAFCAQCKYPEKKLSLNVYFIAVPILMVSFVLIYLIMCFVNRTKHVHL